MSELRTEQQVAEDICRQVSTTCGIACSTARVGPNGSWEVQTAPNVWQSYQELMDGARRDTSPLIALTTEETK